MKATDYFHDMNFVAGLLGYPQESCMCYGIGCKYENKSLGERAGECRKPAHVKCPITEAEDREMNGMDDEGYFCPTIGIDGDECPYPPDERSPLRCHRCEAQRGHLGG